MNIHSVVPLEPRQSIPLPEPRKSNFDSVLYDTPTTTNAKLLRCPPHALDQLRCLSKAKAVTLFTPFVPHSPSSPLAGNMDPFEPLGRAIPHKVRHIPFRLDSGMTDIHAKFLPNSGAVVLAICATSNVTCNKKNAFEQQANFARDVTRRLQRSSASDVPIILVLADGEAIWQAHPISLEDRSTVVSIDDYTPSALTSATRMVFGESRSTLWDGMRIMSEKL